MGKAVLSIGAGRAVALPQRTWLNSALTDCTYHWLCYCLPVLQARPTNPSTDSFQYACPMCNTESGPRCGWLGLNLLNCWLPSVDEAVAFKSLIIRAITGPVSYAYIRCRWFSVPVAQQEMMIMIMRNFSWSFVCFSVCFRMHQNVPQNTQNFLGEHVPRPLP